MARDDKTVGLDSCKEGGVEGNGEVARYVKVFIRCAVAIDEAAPGTAVLERTLSASGYILGVGGDDVANLGVG